MPFVQWMYLASGPIREQSTGMSAAPCPPGGVFAGNTGSAKGHAQRMAYPSNVKADTANTCRARLLRTSCQEYLFGLELPGEACIEAVVCFM